VRGVQLQQHVPCGVAKQVGTDQLVPAQANAAQAIDEICEEGVPEGGCLLRLDQRVQPVDDFGGVAASPFGIDQNQVHKL